MSKFVHKLLLFILPVFIYCALVIFITPMLLREKYGPTTEQQISTSFDYALEKEYDLLILGNSRIYRSLNPDRFSFSAYNFSLDNDAYNQIFYKLEFLVEHKKVFNILILGIDYFQFSFKSESRNYAYGDFLGSTYLSDFNSNLMTLKMKNYYRYFTPKMLLKIIIPPKKGTPFLKKNGQYIFPGIASKQDNIQRNINRLPFQEYYFEKIIELCKSLNVKVFMVMSPTRKEELSSYSVDELKEFNAFINKKVDSHEVFYLNYSRLGTFILEDYTDITHLNESAANKFSEIVNADILRLLQ